MVETRTEKSRDDWRTPPWLIEKIEHTLGSIDYDFCANDKDALAMRYSDNILDTLYNADTDLDPLPRLAFCNPPFCIAKEIVPKLLACAHRLKFPLLMILPVRPETAFWHDHIWHENILFFKGRVNFVTAEGILAPGVAFPSCLVLVNLEKEQLLAMYQAFDGRLVINHKKGLI